MNNVIHTISYASIRDDVHRHVIITRDNNVHIGESSINMSHARIVANRKMRRFNIDARTSTKS